MSGMMGSITEIAGTMNSGLTDAMSTNSNMVAQIVGSVQSAKEQDEIEKTNAFNKSVGRFKTTIHF
jgi:hypothetical protein